MAWRHPGENVAQIRYLHSFRPQNFLIAGRGGGKTAAACKKAEIACRKFPGIIVMITEQTSRDIRDILVPTWREVVTPGIWTPKGTGGDTEIRFLNGSMVWFRSRQAKSTTEDPPFRGPTVGMLIHDELALDRREDVLEISEMMLRQDNAPLCSDVITTPKPNWLYRHILSLGLARTIKTDSDRIQLTDDDLAACFYGNTSHNQYNRDLEGRMRSRLTGKAAAQELDAMWVPLEGKVWDFLEERWPYGNMINSPYKPNLPYSLGVDLGGSDSAWGLYQREHKQNLITGRMEELVILKAEWTPHGINPWIVPRRIKEFTGGRRPSRIAVGADYRTPGNAGVTAEHMFENEGWGSVTRTITGFDASKDIQHQQSAYMICNSMGTRQFCISEQLQSFYPGKTRGLLDVMRHDTFPEAGSRDYFRKEKTKGIYHEDSRDQFMYAAIDINPPSFRPQSVWPS